MDHKEWVEACYQRLEPEQKDFLRKLLDKTNVSALPILPDSRDVDLPKHPTVFIPPDERFLDHRGTLTNLLHRPIGSVVRIESSTDSVRANHIHKTDWHFCYVERGIVEYAERPEGSKERPQIHVYRTGSLFFTGPHVEHAMRFPVETVFYTYGRNSRHSEDYEADLIRIPDLWEEVRRLPKPEHCPPGVEHVFEARTRKCLNCWSGA